MNKLLLLNFSWMGANRLLFRIISIVKIAIIARILIPKEFGIFAIASILLALIEMITETGINVFLIQEKENYKKYINTAWTISIVRGLLIAAIVYTVAPYASQFMNIPQSDSVIKAMSAIAIVRGFINPMIIVFQKELRFKTEFILRTSLSIVDCLFAVVFAYLTKSAIGFVYGALSSAVVELLLSWFFIKPYPIIEIDFTKLKYIIYRGKWVTFTGILNYIHSHLDDLVVGKLVGISSLGLYQSAYRISTLPVSEVSEVANQVTFPTLVKNYRDPISLRKLFKRLSLFVSLTALLMGLFIFIFSREIIIFILGPDWIEANSILKALSIFGILKAITIFYDSFLYAVKKQRYLTNIAFVRFIVIATTIVPLVYSYKMIGAVISSTLSVVVTFPLLYYYFNKKEK